jgi:hypothetical protein
MQILLKKEKQQLNRCYYFKVQVPTETEVFDFTLFATCCGKKKQILSLPYICDVLLSLTLTRLLLKDMGF